MRVPRKRRNGFILIAMCACMFVLLAMIGMAFDFGRIYIARNEAQVFVDAASMAAAKEMDGTATGLTRARAAVEHLPARWNLGTQEFQGVVVDFSSDTEHWDQEPKEAAGLQYARVTAPENHVEIMFLRAVGGPTDFTVPARAVSATNPVRLTQ
jgi:hypothetical protein